MQKLRFIHIFNLFCLIVALIIIVSIFVLDYFFMGLTAEQIVFHVKYYQTMIGLGGNLIKDWRILFAIGLIYLIVIGYFVSRYYKSMFFSVSLLIVAFAGLEYKYKFGDYIYARLVISDFYEKNYVNPEDVEFSFPKTKKNLIILYLESIENIYGNIDLFEKNLLVDLDQYKDRRIGHYQQIIGSNWTIAGLVTTLCGVPLTVGIKENDYGKNGFLANAVCLPQILEKVGYENYWLSTAPAAFANKNKFFEKHGIPIRNVLDSGYFENNFGDKVSPLFLGFDDKYLFPELKRIIKEYEFSKKPLFLAALTVNTHFGTPLSDECKPEFFDYRDVVLCANKQVAHFINWFLNQDISKNSVLLVVGDHLAMDSDIIDRFMGGYLDKREIFNLFLADNVIFLNKERQFSGLDILPTLLDAIGAEWGQKRLGLGVSLLAEGEQNLTEKLGLKLLNDNLRQYSKEYNALSVTEMR